MHGPASAIRESGAAAPWDRDRAGPPRRLEAQRPLARKIVLTASAAANTRGARRLMSLSPENVYAVVRSIPRGKVATYGQIAELAGVANGHRIVARAMRSCPERLPWQRVVGKKDARRGQINIDDPDHAALQRGLLEAEGVRFDAAGFIPLGRFGWRLDEPSRADGGERRRPAAKGGPRRAPSGSGPKRRAKKRAASARS
jgi:methylated-DNA-protein-cysteine methyltransferase related protein